MRSIIKWFVDNPVAANLLMTVLIVGGLISLVNIRQEEFPEVDLEIITVTVPYLGATPEEVEEGVCIRIEEALEGSENVFKMTSTSSEGSCTVQLELDSGTDMIRALNDIKGKVDSINTFPAETERPIVSQVTATSQVSDIVISGDTDERSLKALAEQMREEIAAIDGISQVTMEYVRPDEISVEVSETTLRRYGLTLDAVASAIRRSSLNLPGGAIKAGGGEILVRTQGQYYRGPEFEDIVVLTRQDGTALRLGEIANVIDGFEEGDLRVRFNGMPAAMVRVYLSFRTASRSLCGVTRPRSSVPGSTCCSELRSAASPWCF
jgi:multidrug efflux pump subunit AcrB